MTEQQQPCYKCAGTRVVEAQRYTVELDANGNQVPKHESYTAMCDACGGTGLAH